MLRIIKWVAALLGFYIGRTPVECALAAGGGFILGYMAELLLEKPHETEVTVFKEVTPEDQKNFMVGLMTLSALVVKADGRYDKHEVAFISAYLSEQVEMDFIAGYIKLLEVLLKENYEISDVCGKIKQQSSYEARLIMLQFLFGIANADYNIDDTEFEILLEISRYLEITPEDYYSIRAMYFKEVDSNYKILEIKPSASDSELKAAFHFVAHRYHPDKVLNLGAIAQKAAQEKFQKVADAYQAVLLERGVLKM